MTFPLFCDTTLLSMDDGAVRKAWVMEQGKLKPDGYQARIADAQVGRLLDTFGAVEIAGPMWCGKTWTSLSFAASVSRIGRAAERSLAKADPSTALLGDQPHAIDEWQDVPEIWDEVRYRVDETRNHPGQFILTGSSEPQKERLHHSGAGRIATYRMSTMTLAEMGASSGTVSLAGLFDGNFTPVLAQQGLETYAGHICRGGWPALLETQADAWNASGGNSYVENYLDALFEVSLPRRGLDAGVGRRVAQSLARNVGQSAKYLTIAQDAGIMAASDKEAAEIASRYVSELVRLYVVEEVPGWDAPIRSKSRLRVRPKRYFADPSIPATLLGASKDRIMKDGQLFGLLFESLAMHDLRVYASAVPGATRDSLRYYRDADGLEVDAIIELDDGRWAGIEIKLGENKVPEGIASLRRLQDKIARNPAARNPTPSFLAVLVGAGVAARQDRDSGVYVIPLTCLGA